MRNRRLQEVGEAIVAHLLVFYGTAYCYVVISGSPVRRKALGNSVYTFGYKKETQIFSYPHHIPCCRSPRIGSVEKKVGAETGIYQGARCYFIVAVLFALYRQREGRCLCNLAALSAITRVEAIYVAIAATL